MTAAAITISVIWYSCPSGRKYAKVCECGRAEMLASRPLIRNASAPAAATGVNNPRISSTAATISPPALTVGEDVGVLVADVGQ